MDITALWNRHYTVGVTGAYSGDMARAFALMLADSDCTPDVRQKLTTAISAHCGIERSHAYSGRRWFSERWSR